MAITQTISAFPTAPNSGTDTPAEFDTKANAFVNHQANIYEAEVNTLVAQINAESQSINNIIATIPAGVINDSGIGLTYVWSSTKVNTELSHKADKLQVIGSNQTWQNMTSQRAADMNYATGAQPIEISVLTSGGNDGTAHASRVTVTIDNTLVFIIGGSYGEYSTAVGTMIIPPNSNYRISATPSIDTWHELRA